ncbi:MAG: D-2-hydroxyacid dehydrogenase [Actinomycetota bacterium]
MSGTGARLPVVVVMGATADEPPPGIDVIAGAVDLRYAPDRAALEREIVDAEVVYTWWGDREDLEAAWHRAGGLKWLAAVNVGIERLLFPALVESDVILTNARGAADQPIAETVVGFVVAMAKGFRPMFDRQRMHVWDLHVMERLAGSRVLVVGPGPIGRTIARALRDGLGMRVAAIGRSGRDGDDLFETIGGADDLHAALSEADYVIDTMPLTPQTRHVFDAEAFAAMKPTARFVNVGRGATVVERALVDALASGVIAGAALDVYEEEPLPADSALWDMENVIVCPHMSGDVDGTELDFARVFYDNVGRWLRGEPLRNVVDKRLGFPTDDERLP